MIHKLAAAFNAGGPFMWVILAIFAAAFAIVMERLVFYYVTCRIRGGRLILEISEAIRKGESKKTGETLGKSRAPLQRMLAVIVERFSAGLPVEKLEDGIQESAIEEMPRLSQRLNYLSLIANVATLVGLIGTISGLQSSFSSLAAVEASKKAAMLAAGIAEAMYCTAFGLIVAVPCMILYTFFYNAQQKLAKDIDQSVLRLLNFIKSQKA